MTDGARVFREAWIAGVRRHYPGEPKAGYVTPWEDTPEWERESVGAVYRQVRDFLAVTDGAAAKLTRVQKGQFVAACWTGQIHRHFPHPKPSYVAEWDALPDWQQQTDADIFQRIEQDHAQDGTMSKHS
ncbi:hypothetical protein ABZ816_33355 [Actinosynnema sp. NPDC047251]|uniref:Uncharacterized protein n=1 Tax=Saccharothrix espanaensis (strain ATCC 51144 / DSM 44229 / JCM 9112 / NBRC 15066 / NRRL 15764) TaxID=1179773 RepID=K0K3W3_SACES|nr:hypothetical protein [Saccharothrix espanaensis]CCH33001.1 hypothetical protein BN6_57430 [Saccharothrix espanaensis DSM 44229]